IREPTVYSYALLAVVSALHLLGGFVQIAMLSGVLVVLFILVYARQLARAGREWLRQAALAVGAFVFRNALVSFYLWPLLEAMVTTFNKDIPQLALFVPIGIGNAIAFFFPFLFGFSFYQGWSPGPAVADWENLYAFAGTAVLVFALF